MPVMLLAALLLLARLIGPADAMPASQADAVEQIALHSLCSGGPAGEQSPAPHQHDCLLCPACHLGTHVALPAPAGPALPQPVHQAIGLAAAVPEATGPPHRARAAAQPTGPPLLSV